MKKTNETFISNLRRLRKAKFRSQAEFAEAVGLSLRGYQKYEQGESSPTAETLERFSRALGCQPWELVKPEVVPTPPKEGITLRDLAYPERLAEKLDRLEKLEKNEIERLEAQLQEKDQKLQQMEALIGPHRPILKALNERPEMVEAVQAFLGLIHVSDEDMGSDGGSNQTG